MRVPRSRWRTGRRGAGAAPTPTPRATPPAPAARRLAARRRQCAAMFPRGRRTSASDGSRSDHRPCRTSRWTTCSKSWQRRRRRCGGGGRRSRRWRAGRDGCWSLRWSLDRAHGRRRLVRVARRRRLRRRRRGHRSCYNVAAPGHAAAGARTDARPGSARSLARRRERDAHRRASDAAARRQQPVPEVRAFGWRGSRARSRSNPDGPRPRPTPCSRGPEGRRRARSRARPRRSRRGALPARRRLLGHHRGRLEPAQRGADPRRARRRWATRCT